MAQIYLINYKYIQENTNLTAQVEENMIVPSLKVAQDKHAEVYLGTNLLNKIKDGIDNDNLSGIYVTILNEYVKPMLCQWTMVELYPYLLVKHDNSTLTIRSGEDFQPITETQFKMLVDAATNNAQMYTERMIRYLCQNSSSIPEYTNNQYPNLCPRKSAYSQNTMRFSSGNTASSNPLLNATSLAELNNWLYAYNGGYNG